MHDNQNRNSLFMLNYLPKSVPLGFQPLCHWRLQLFQCIYQSALERAPGSAELAQWTAAFASGQDGG